MSLFVASSLSKYMIITVLCTSYLSTNGESLRGNSIGNQKEMEWSKESQQFLLNSLQHGLLSTVQKKWGQCGGKKYNGPTECESGCECIMKNEWYSQCKPKPIQEGQVPLWGQCDGENWTGDTQCVENAKCIGNKHYRQCRPCGNDDPCLSDCDLLNFEPWVREEGYWVGDYIFLNGNGDVYESGDWNYPYGDYKGFIVMNIEGNSLKQRNVFLYPPQDIAKCGGVVGNGVCGTHGNEKVFEANQEAVDCSGNLAGPFVAGPYTLDTATTIMGNDTIVYRVSLGPLIFQNQLTTLTSAGIRVRTAQGFDFGQNPSYGSFYRERRVSKEEWLSELSAAREAYNIRTEDYCGWTSANTESEKSCCEHFMMTFPGLCTYSQ